MPRRSSLNLAQIADVHNMALAFTRAAKGKRRRPEVMQFEACLWDKLYELGDEIRTLTVSVGRFTEFCIRDPKLRWIHAPCFRERVLHHAMMAKMGPVLERALVADTYACRVGKGVLAAVERAEAHLRRYPWFVKVDIRSYFDSICQCTLYSHLERRFKDKGLLGLCRRVLTGYSVSPERGLPIGALTSQYFANLYLSSLDRYLLECLKVGGMVRYMDDCVWWVQDVEQAKASLRAVRRFVETTLKLKLHPRAYIQRSTRGLSFLGYRLFPTTRRLSPRRRHRYLRARHAWERAYGLGLIDSQALQRGYEGALATVAHADSRGLRWADLNQYPAVDA